MYRSQMLDILQPQHIKELCSFMVVVSAEIAKKRGETNHVIENGKEMDQLGTSSFALSSQEAKRVHNQDDVSNLSTNKSNKISTYAFASAGFDLQSGRSVSPETLPLLSNEKTTTDQNPAVRSSDFYSQGLESEPREQKNTVWEILASQIDTHMNRTGILESNVSVEEPVRKLERSTTDWTADYLMNTTVSEVQGLNMTHGEQERLVLTKLCGFLKKTIRN